MHPTSYLSQSHEVRTASGYFIRAHSTEGPMLDTFTAAPPDVRWWLRPTGPTQYQCGATPLSLGRSPRILLGVVGR